MNVVVIVFVLCVVMRMLRLLIVLWWWWKLLVGIVWLMLVIVCRCLSNGISVCVVLGSRKCCGLCCRWLLIVLSRCVLVFVLKFGSLCICLFFVLVCNCLSELMFSVLCSVFMCFVLSLGMLSSLMIVFGSVWCKVCCSL